MYVIVPCLISLGFFIFVSKPFCFLATRICRVLPFDCQGYSLIMPAQMECFENTMLNPVRNVMQTQLLGTEVRMNECQEKILVSPTLFFTI